ncbi:phytanoyl-CoA dioxygenase family protein [Paenibacillus sepulcri]|uniref:Phytanoyl-CoA dioxygenase family protein n=1 Tax=Paenibacillus sepulcri TaxID=359917 RepID=A0ABS7BXC3_9BACL|nr:phytanoyl-CoA dioxygenase family protein [Paenibacillus sepulcri]
MLTEEQKQRYYEDGVLVLKGLIAPEKLQEYRDAYERMVEKVRAYPGREKYNARIIGAKSKNKIETKSAATVAQGNTEQEYWGADWLLHPDLYEPAFTDYLENEELISSLKSLLGSDIGIYGLKALWSPVNVNYDLAWHRDGKQEVYSTDGGIPPGWLQFNTALYREESFRVVKGSHRRPLTDEENAKYGTVEEVAGEEVCVLEAGEVLFMHQAVLHRGKAQAEMNGGSKRRAFHYILARTDFAVGRRRLEQFKGWYEELGLAGKLGPTAKPLFENFFAWEGRAFDDASYPYPEFKKEDY